MSDPRYGTAGLRRWLMLSFGLLAIYLAFFHLVTFLPPEHTLLTGIVFAHGWTLVCICFQRWFANKFEFAIHLVIAADIQLEAFLPYHQGYGFYFCAISFWSVFWYYHFVVLKAGSKKSGQ